MEGTLQPKGAIDQSDVDDADDTDDDDDHDKDDDDTNTALFLVYPINNAKYYS